MRRGRDGGDGDFGGLEPRDLWPQTLLTSLPLGQLTQTGLCFHDNILRGTPFIYDYLHIFNWQEC